MNPALIGLAALGLLLAWVIGGVLLRVGGLFLVLGGASALAVAGDVYGVPIAGLGVLIWLAGHWHFALRHQEFKSPLARQFFSRLAPTWLDPTRDLAVAVRERRCRRGGAYERGGRR